MSKVSIILPIYNVEKYLDRCMDSLLNQTLEDIEIIMVDDGSPDNCPQMCDEYAKKDNRVKVVHKKNAGLGFARNSGLDVATGEYVAFVDSDDYVGLDMYKTLYDRAEVDKCDAVFCGFRTEVRENKWMYSDEVDADKLWKGKNVQQFMLDMIASGAGINAERIYQMSVWHSIYKRSFIEEKQIRFVSEREVASEDIPFQVDFLSKANTVAYVSKTFYSYCLNGTSLTATLKPEKYARYKHLRACLLAKSSDAEYVSRVNRLFIGYTRSHLYDIINSTWKHKVAMINEIQNDEVWKEVRSDYSPANLPLVSKCIYKFLLSPSAWLLYILMCLMNAARKRRGGADFLFYELAEDLKRFDNHSPTLKDRILHNEVWYIFHYIRHLRYVEYYQDKNKLKFLWHFFWYKRLGFKLRMTIYPNTIGPGFRIYHAGDFVHVGPKVRIGRNCTMLPGVVFGNKMEGVDEKNIIVGDDCYFGLGVKIIGSVRIGNNVTVGANAVITKDIPDNAIVGGVPAKIIKMKK
mgnify:CR=1 FL=1